MNLAGQHAIWSIARAGTRRSLLLCATGAVIGLLIAGFGLFTAQGTRTAHVPPEDAALVNGVPILMADFIGQLQALYGVSLSQAKPEQKKKILEDMIREELYVQRGVDIGLTNDDVDVRTALIAATEAQVASDAMTSVPTEQELRDWYRNHRDRYASEGMLELQEFVVPPARAADADRIVQALRSGAAPATLGLTSSGRMDDGEEFYFAAKAHLGSALFAVARGLGDGAVSPPIRQANGVRILVMKHNRLPVPVSFEAARDKVTADFLRDKAERLQVGNERFLRKRADIRFAPGLS
jgi:hypothetical protein